MLSGSDAFLVVTSLSSLRAYGARVALADLLGGIPDPLIKSGWARTELSEATTVARRRVIRGWEGVEPSLKWIDGALVRNGLTLEAPRSSAWKKWGAAVYALAAANVEPGSLAAHLLELGSLAADVSAEAQAVGGVLGLGTVATADAKLGQELERRTSSMAGAIYCLEELIREVRPRLSGEELSPSVGDAVDALGKWLGTLPPITRDRGASSRAMEAWASSLEEKLRVMRVALSFAPEPRDLAPASAEEIALLATILERPEDDAPRAAYADLALARRDPRGTLVREQMKTATDRRRFSLDLAGSEQARHLLGRHPEWSEDVRRLGATQVTFFRGFVEEVTIDAGLFLENAEALFRVAPIRAVRLTSAAPRLADVAGFAPLGRLVALGLAKEGLDDSHLNTLAASPHLRGLLSLDLSGNQVTDEGLKVLAASAGVPSLLQCLTGGNPCRPFYVSDWSHQELPTQEWNPTPFVAEMEAAFGRKRWFHPFSRPLVLDELRRDAS